MPDEKPISRWIFTAAKQTTPCPKCHALADEPCRTPSGRQTTTPHKERVKVYHDSLTEEEFKRRHSITPVS